MVLPGLIEKRPCRICGKTTYRGFSRDEGTSICTRISAGARWLSRNGGIYTSIPKFHRTLPLQPSIGHSFATKESRISTYSTGSPTWNGVRSWQPIQCNSMISVELQARQQTRSSAQFHFYNLQEFHFMTDKFHLMPEPTREASMTSSQNSLPA